MSHTIHIIIMCNNITVFTKSAQKCNILQFYSVGLILFTELTLQACIFLLMEESHLVVGGWVYIETPAKNGKL